MSSTPLARSEALDGLLGDLRCLDDQDLIDALEDATAARRAADAQEAALLVVLNERSEAAAGMVGAGCEEIGWLLAVSSRSAARLVDSCIELTDRPLVWDGLHLGLIDRIKAIKIVTLLADVPDPLRERLEATAIAYGQLHTAAQLHRKLVAMTCDHDPDQAQRQRAVDNRTVHLEHRGHGMAWVSAYLSAEHAEAFMASLDQLAKSSACADPYAQGEDRTLDQRRADALTGYLEDHTFWDIQVNVTIPADMLLGVETKGASLNGSPVTHALATHLAWSPDARWTRLVTDPLSGVLLDAGREKYEIPKPLRNAVRLRDVTCRWHGCTRKAEYTDTDHVIAHRISKWTKPDDLACLCRHHHRMKTFGTWQTRTTSTYARDITWIAPMGTTRTTKPPDHHRRD
jgi:hypothetical protein